MNNIQTTATVDGQGRLVAQLNGVPAGQYEVTLTLRAITPPAPQFADIRGHWAEPFITALTAAGLISGFPDRTFRPNEWINRAQFAALIQAAFDRPFVRDPMTFVDVAATFWAAGAIAKTYQMGILTGFPNRQFRPLENLTKLQILIALVNALNPPASGVDRLILASLYQDAAQIPTYGETPVKYATRLELVVNHPQVNQLRPQQAVTRGEVCAMLYQALVQQGRMPPLSSPYIVIPPPPPRADVIPLQHQREFRAAWVATVWNINFPSRRDLTTAAQQQELRMLLDNLVDLRFNAIIFQVRPEGDALYASSLEPWSAWLTGRQGQAPNPSYDPLAFLISEAQQRAIEVHAWFNPYRARVSRNNPVVAPHLDARHPEVIYNYGTQRWMDPGSAIVQDHTYNVILDVVRRYDIDGIHLDDYFYPYPVQGEEFPDGATYSRYRNDGGTLSLGDWRRDNVNKMVQRLAAGIRATKPHVKFGISPFGIYRPGQPSGITGLDQYNVLFADPKHWLAQGWVDYIAPQLYWRIDQVQQSYPVLLDWWAANNPRGAHIYPGNNLVRLDGTTWPVSEFERQVSLTRDLRGRLALGNIFYNIKPLVDNPHNIRAAFQDRLYAQPALVPLLRAQGGRLPPLPLEVRGTGGQLSWQADPQAGIWGWTVYESLGGNWRLRQVLPGGRRSVNLPPGRYGLCAVNRQKQESEAVMVTVG
ncbi:MAG: hypothetical protein EA366_15555 [Spirulina sp. DLM2.Bin59]|nr:MAG: hypothetical protein EA366_15555 [Spirulina sp. DLM2.Bin59]